jgi:hypothetical protein
MSKLIIHRKSEWNNRGRKIGIYIDGKKIGTINNGETQKYDLGHGRHEIFAKIDWCRSSIIELNVLENEERTLYLSGFKYGTWIYPVLLAIMMIYYLLKHALNIDLEFIIWIGVIVFLYPIYFITIGSHNYLRLSEHKTTNISEPDI